MRRRIYQKKLYQEREIERERERERKGEMKERKREKILVRKTE